MFRIKMTVAQHLMRHGCTHFTLLETAKRWTKELRYMYKNPINNKSSSFHIYSLREIVSVMHQCSTCWWSLWALEYTIMGKWFTMFSVNLSLRQNITNKKSNSWESQYHPWCEDLLLIINTALEAKDEKIIINHEVFSILGLLSQQR